MSDISEPRPGVPRWMALRDELKPEERIYSESYCTPGFAEISAEILSRILFVTQSTACGLLHNQIPKHHLITVALHGFKITSLTDPDQMASIYHASLEYASAKAADTEIHSHSLPDTTESKIMHQIMNLARRVNVAITIGTVDLMLFQTHYQALVDHGAALFSVRSHPYYPLYGKTRLMFEGHNDLPGPGRVREIAWDALSRLSPFWKPLRSVRLTDELNEAACARLDRASARLERQSKTRADCVDPVVISESDAGPSGGHIASGAGHGPALDDHPLGPIAI